MIALLVSLVVSASPDVLTTVKIDPAFSFKAPTQWTASEADGEKTWSTGESAKVSVSVWAVDPVRPAKACVQQMVDALGTEGFTGLTLEAQPASKKIITDYVGEGEEAKVDANKVTTTTVVGCNGRTKWLLTFTAKTAEGARFGPVLKRILDSVHYGK